MFVYYWNGICGLIFIGVVVKLLLRRKYKLEIVLNQ